MYYVLFWEKEWVLAAPNQAFYSYEAAEKFAETISLSKEPFIVKRVGDLINGRIN